MSAIENSENADQNNLLYGKTSYFTGKLNLFSWTEAARLVANDGGKPQNGITKETDYFIIGTLIIKGYKSTKLKKTEKISVKEKNFGGFDKDDIL